MNNRVLLVEDDSSLSEVIFDYLEMNNFEVDLCQDGKEAWKAFNNNKYNICVIDVMLPRLDGFSLAEKIRKEDKYIPIIFMTAKSMQEDKIKGLKIGADDYLTKPFDPEELVLRIKAILKRSNLAKDSFETLEEIVDIGPYKFNTATFELNKKDKSLKLTPKEGKLLCMLYKKKSGVLNRTEALKEIWHKNDRASSRSMDVYILKLRNHFEEDNDVEIQNYHGKGFKLVVS